MQEQKFKRSKPWGAKKVVTVNDLQKQIDQETNARNNAQGAGKSMQEQWGIRALDLTNKFRAKEGNRSALAWSQPLHDIAMVHSKNMAEGKVPFSHEGF